MKLPHLAIATIPDGGDVWLTEEPTIPPAGIYELPFEKTTTEVQKSHPCSPRFAIRLGLPPDKVMLRLE